MISLKPGSFCDVCAEEYGSHNYPHSMPCGHVLCLNCCNNILKKTPTRVTPSCPFCRVPFTSDTIRLVRVEFSNSGRSTPARATADAPDVALDSDDDVLLLTPSSLKDSRAEARRLEYKVAKVAAKKCSVEEVENLHQELKDWLSGSSDVKSHDDQKAALQLSAALLHAILVNHVAHKQATDMAKAVESDLRNKLAQVDKAKEEAEEELRRRTQCATKVQEIQTLRAELIRLKLKAGESTTSPTPRPPSTASFMNPRSGATSPTSPTSPTRASFASSVQSSLSLPRISAASAHARSASTIPGYRSMAPATRPASAIPTHTRTLSSGTQAVHRIPSRQLSSLPPKMTRSTSAGSDENEKEKQRERDARRLQLMQFWYPAGNAASGKQQSKPASPNVVSSSEAAASVLPRRCKPSISSPSS
ncbi:uncharacterized protein LAESUDRAFT_728996 [Laetiporus sulphureus 93-53]|uniref:RING-type domain-containing protein n=1 Tax=Laetiporus sulphureus 93-53 TaxID=1314785 RepID=A0A165CXV2_9APHY|nr:uncharacterized protein LAESUDRAFT_728996 [Laetiporus sulphureus 93-53]KZT03699.1 hypothetical protein LAESUDRAFT_728996 [Laetiporus sulphureus 93-53]